MCDNSYYSFLLCTIVMQQVSSLISSFFLCVSAESNALVYISLAVYVHVQALSKNGKVYGNGIMIGVQPCIDKVCV